MSFLVLFLLDLSSSSYILLVLKAKTLVGQGANPDDLTTDGKTPVNVAASKGHSGVISVLAAMGASIDKPDARFGFTPVSE